MRAKACRTSACEPVQKNEVEKCDKYGAQELSRRNLHADRMQELKRGQIDRPRYCYGKQIEANRECLPMDEDVAAVQEIVGRCTDNHCQGRGTPGLDAAGDEHGHHRPVQEGRRTAGRQESGESSHPSRITVRGKFLIFKIILIHG